MAQHRYLSRPLRALSLAAALLLAAPAVLAEAFTGVIYPLRDLTLSLGVGGVIAELPVEPGQKVRAKQVLMVLDDRLQSIEAERRKVVWEDSSELDTTEKRLAIVKSLYEDGRGLYQTGSVSRDELRALEVDFISTEGRLQQLKSQELRERLEYRIAEEERQLRRLLAPVAGVIISSELDVGEWAKPGEPLMRLVDASVCVLRVSVPVAVARHLKKGMALPVSVEGLEGPPVQGKITFVSPAADAASGLVELKVTFANPDLRVRPGVTGQIQWNGPT